MTDNKLDKIILFINKYGAIFTYSTFFIWGIYELFTSSDMDKLMIAFLIWLQDINAKK